MNKVLFYFLLAGMIACKNDAEKTEASQKPGATEMNRVELSDAQLANASIAVDSLSTRAITMRIKVSGLVDVPPQSMVSVSIPLGGYLKSTKLLPGMRIRKGEVLAVLEDPQYIQLQQDYLVAAAKLRYAEADFNRQQALSSTQAASEKTLQMARAEFENQQITTKALAAKLALIHINPATLSAENISRTVQVFSPIDGFVSKVNVNIGKYVSPTEVLFELVDPSDIHLSLNVFEKDAPYLKIGQQVLAFSNHQPELKHEAEIFLVSHNINEDRAVQVHCHFEDYDPLLLPGMYMNAEVVLNNRSVMALPQDAIVGWQNKTYVFEVLSKNSFEMKEVKVNGSSNGFSAVEPVGAAWKPNAMYVTKNAYTLLMKLKNQGED